MTTIITYKLFSSRSGKYGHCFLTVDTFVMNGMNILADSHCTMSGDSYYSRRMLLRNFRDFLHADDNGATRVVWASDIDDGAVTTIQKAWDA